LSKHCLGSGQPFTLSLSFSNGISFSSPGFNPLIQNSRTWTPPFRKKSKNPSQRRRDQRRWEEHQVKKSTPAAGSTPATEQESSSKGPPVVEHPQTLPVVDHPLTPPVMDHPQPPKSSPLPAKSRDSQESMEVDIPPPSIQEKAAENVPEIHTRNTETETPTIATTDDLPSVISQINPPMKQKPKSNKKPQTEELHLSLCAPNIGAAARFGRKFSKSTYVGPHPRNEHHFIFSTHIENTNLNQMKSMINEFSDTMNLIKIRVLSENKNYFPDKAKHCEKCISCHVRK